MEAGGSDLFVSYEQDYSTIAASIESKLKELRTAGLQGEQRKSVVRALERELEEADEILSSMDTELYSLPPTTRAKLQPKFRNYKADFERVKKDFAKVSAASAKEQLLGSGADPLSPLDDSPSFDQRQRLVQGTERLNQASNRLMESHRIALETEQTGIATLQELRRQREQIEHTRNTLREADSNVDRATRTLRSMARRLATNKLLTAAIIVILVLLILMTLYIKIRG
ncbi:t-SNARE VTI1 [Sorochytrium milnesiophthora]